MRITDRAPSRIVSAPFTPRHWSALRRMFTTFDHPTAALMSYLSNRGAYPRDVTLRTPIGPVTLTLQDRHDLLTVNEVFCRQDYGPGTGVCVMVDVGANVGFAALFFLTRSPDSRVHCFEPDPANTARLRHTLAAFESRYVLTEKAVTPTAVEVLRFVPAGRYGHTASADEDAGAVELPAIGFGEALNSILAQESVIDLVKIDTEGSEFTLLTALRESSAAPFVRQVVYEDNAGRARWA